MPSLRSFIVLLALLFAAPAHAEITLPQPPRPVVDFTDTLTAKDEQQLTQTITKLEKDLNWKVRVLTINLKYRSGTDPNALKDQTPGQAVKPYWGLDDRSILVVMNTREDNPLNFNVGDEYRQTLPRVFWRELQARYGNKFYVAEHGRSQAMLATVSAIDESLRQGGRPSVPGLTSDHQLFTFVLSLIGGLVAGFASHPRSKDERFNWKGFLISAPLWAILFVSFGIGPVVTRTTDLLPLAQNIGGFLLGMIIALLIPTPKKAKQINQY